MPRVRKEQNRYWSVEDKLKIIKEAMINGNRITGRKYDISYGLISNWIKKYETKGEDGLKNSKKPGNPLSKYAKRKSLSEMEQLEYENMKLRIENERLKKGYLVKGDGQTKQFISLKNRNFK
jgi:transposase